MLALVWLAALTFLSSTNAFFESLEAGDEFRVPQDLVEAVTGTWNAATPDERRDMAAQDWSQFNQYFNGIASEPYPKNQVTFFGKVPGFCPSVRTNNRCDGFCCTIREPIASTPIPVPVLGSKRLCDWIFCDDCTNKPGQLWLYQTDIGAVTVRGIYLTVLSPTGTVVPITPLGKSFSPTCGPLSSECSFRNEIQLLFTLSEFQFDLMTRLDVDRVVVRPFRIFIFPIGPITFSRNNMGFSLAKGSQTISSTQHGISFRSTLYFQSNRWCSNEGSRPSSCIYRSDKAPSYYQASRTETFKEGIAYQINLPRSPTASPASWPSTAAYDDSACLWDFANQYATYNPSSNHRTEFGLSIDIGPLCGINWFGTTYDICRDVVNAVLKIVVAAILKGILCSIFTSMFWLGDTSNTPTTSRGLLNIGILNLYTFFRKYVETPLQTKAMEQTYEDVTAPALFNANGYVWPAAGCAASSYCPYRLAINFNTSAIFKAVSLGLNGLLGNKSTTAGYTNKLVIVEVIDILLGNKFGTLQLGICNGVAATCTLGYCAGTCDGDIKAELKLSSYPNFTWTGQPVFNGRIQLNGILLDKLNSITSFKILDNGFEDGNPDYTHTLMNDFRMDSFFMEFYVNIILSDGSWVHRPRDAIVPANQIRSIPLSTNVIVQVDNVRLILDLFMLLRPDLLSNKKIGSLLGNWPSGSLTKRLNCASYMFDLVQVSKFQVGGALSRLEFRDFFGALGTLITSGTAVFNLGYQSATETFLPFLSESWMRPQINKYLKDNTFDGVCGGVFPNCPRPFTTDICSLGYPYYFTNTNPNRWINFYDSKVWNAIKGVVNDVVGGIPVRTGSASVNNIIDTYLDWYLPVLARTTNVTLVKRGNTPGFAGNIDYPEGMITLRSSTYPDTRYITIDRIGVRNFESIHELSLVPTAPSKPYEANLFFKMGGGKIWDRTNNNYITMGLLTFRFRIKSEVSVYSFGDPMLFNYADDTADVELRLGNVTFLANVLAKYNQNNFLDLTWGDVNHVACQLALLDEFSFNSLLASFASFRLWIDRNQTGYRSRDQFCSNKWDFRPNGVYGALCVPPTPSPTVPTHRILRFSDALDYLAWESGNWGTKVDNMVDYIFKGIAEDIRVAANAFFTQKPPLATCASADVIGGTFIAKVKGLIGANSTYNTSTQQSFLAKLSTNQENPRFPQYPKGTSATGVNAISYGAVCGLTCKAQIGYPASGLNPDCTPKPYNTGVKSTSCWEKDVVDDANAVNMRTNFLVVQAQNFLINTGQKTVVDAMNLLAEGGPSIIKDNLLSFRNGTRKANGDLCVSVIDGSASYCIDVDARNLTGLGIPVLALGNDGTIPGLRIEARRLRIENLHTFRAGSEEFQLLKPYTPNQYAPMPASDDPFMATNARYKDEDAKYTLAHRIKFGDKTTSVYDMLNFIIDIDVSVARKFIDKNAPAVNRNDPVTDTLSISFAFRNLDMLVLSQTAFNQSRLLEVPFYYFLNPGSPESCLYSIFYENGLYLPQLQVYVDDIVGPVTNVSSKTGGTPNIFSKGVAQLISATLDMAFQILKENIPDATQGELRSYVNRVLSDWVTRARNAIGPGSCPAPTKCSTDPHAMCHYYDFLDPSFDRIFNAMNSMLGGNPVTTGALDVNTLLDLTLDQFLIQDQLLGESFEIVHFAKGKWIFPTVFSFTSSFGDSHFIVSNINLYGLNSIYRLAFSRFPPSRRFELGLDVHVGNGTMINGTNDKPFASDPLGLSLDVDVLVNVYRRNGQVQTIANTAFRVALEFADFNVATIQQLLINKTDAVRMSITQVSKRQCILAIIDDVSLTQFNLTIGKFATTLLPFGTFGRDSSCGIIPALGQKCHIAYALDKLRVEAARTNLPAPPSKSVPTSMVNAVLRNIGSFVSDGFNGLDLWNKSTVNCQIPSVILNILDGVANINESRTLVMHLTANMSGMLIIPTPVFSSDFSTITIQSSRITAERGAFVQEIITSAEHIGVTIIEGSFCDALNLGTIATTACNLAFGSSSSNITERFIEYTRPQINYIRQGTSPFFLQRFVKQVNYLHAYNVMNSRIVKTVTRYFDDHANDFNALMRTVANQTSFLFIEPDQTVTIRGNLTQGMLWADENLVGSKSCDGTPLTSSTFKFASLLQTSNLIIPSFRFIPGRVEILNAFSLSKLIVFRPYVGNLVAAQIPVETPIFITQNELQWKMPGKALTVFLEFDLEFDQAFTTGATIPSGTLGRERVNISIALEEFSVQLLTLLAVDTLKLGYTSLSNFLSVDSDQKFYRNCQAFTCLLTSVYEGGMSLPQFTLNVSDITGPKFRTSRRLFSEGMELFVDSLIEIVVQIFRESLSSITQGPVRDMINNKLTTLVGTSKKSPADGGCPAKFNYTDFYPLGRNYCAYNDTKGVISTLTQEPNTCKRKRDRKTCLWQPPDGNLDINTVACYYNPRAKDLNFRNARGLQQLKTLLNSSLMNPDSAFYVNKLLTPVSNLRSNMSNIVNQFPIKSSGNSYGTFSLSVGNFRLEHLNTINKLQLLDNNPYSAGRADAFVNSNEYEAPVGRRRALLASSKYAYEDNKYMSRTAVRWDRLLVGMTIDFTFEQLFLPTDDNPTGNVGNVLTVELTLNDFEVAIDLYMLVNIPRLMDLQIQSVASLVQLPCVLNIFEDNGLVPVKANITYGSIEFSLDCPGTCDSPLFRPLMTTPFTEQSSQSLAVSFTRMVQRLTNFAISFVASSQAQNYLNNQIAVSSTNCDTLLAGGIPQYPTFSKKTAADTASAMGIAGLSLLMASFVGFAFLVPVHFRRRDELMKRALLDAHERGAAAAGKTKDEFELAERRLKSAYEHPDMPRWVRFLVPFVILINVILFATANFGAVGASVELTLTLAGDTSQNIVLLPFTLARSINDMWASGAYALAILIAVASGGWPYVKQLLLLFCWFAPCTVLHPDARGRLMEILDALGKWSLIDLYVLMMLMVAFYFYISSSYASQLSLLPPDVLVVKVTVVPMWGIYGFVLGAIGSLLINHLMIWWHRKCIRADEDFQDAILGTLVKDLRTPRIPLSRHRFNILDSEGRPYHYSVTTRVLIVAFMAVTSLLILIGCVLPVITFTFYGLAGLAISLIDSNLGQVTHSVVSIGTSIMSGVANKPAAILGIIFLQIIFVLWSLIIPIVLMVLLTVIWVVPLTLREQLLLYFVAEVLSAWEAVMVLVVSLFAAMLQISVLAQFIVSALTGGICDAIEAQLQNVFPNPQDAKCFDVSAVPRPVGFAVLCLAALGIIIFGGIAFRLIKAAVDDRELAMRRKPPHSPGEMTGLTGFLVRRSLEAFGASQIQNAGSVANLYAQGQGAFENNSYSQQMVPSMNPIMTRESAGISIPTANPLYKAPSYGAPSRNAHVSIDV